MFLLGRAPRIPSRARQHLIIKVWSRNLFDTFTTSGIPTLFMKSIRSKHKRWVCYTLRYVVHLGDIPAECIARVVGHEQTVSDEVPSVVALAIQAIHTDFCASGDRLLEKKNNIRTKFGLIQFCVNFVLHCPNQDELTKGPLQYQEKGTEVVAHTAELQSKEGNTDITDETAQCEKCKEHNAKRKVFLHMWSNFAGIISRKDKNS